MRHMVLACAALSLGILSSPLAAQQTPPEQAPPASQQLPPPPPFPPMPSSRPSHRWVDVGEHHHAAPTHHHATSTHHGRKHASHRPTRKHAPALHLSRRTIRQCHAMTYKQIMRHSNCRALMKQDLAAADRRRHHSARSHKGKAHHHKARHHG